MVTDAKKKAVAKFDAQHAYYISLKLYDSTDSDIIKQLNSVGNKQGYIKRLIREDIERSQ